MSFELWAKHMNHNPKNPGWENRDRFILSGGHGSTPVSYTHLDVYKRQLLEELLAVMEKNTDTFMPGFTHLQKAQPITLAHHMGDVYKRQLIQRQWRH